MYFFFFHELPYYFAHPNTSNLNNCFFLSGLKFLSHASFYYDLFRNLICSVGGTNVGGKCCVCIPRRLMWAGVRRETEGEVEARPPRFVGEHGMSEHSVVSQ